MAQVRAALRADGLCADHAMAAVDDIRDGTRDRLRKTGPPATRIKFGHRVEQFGSTANTVVAAVRPMGLVFARKRPLCGCVAGDVQRDCFSAFFLQNGLPLSICFLDGEGHDEQLISMEDAQSGGNAA